MYALNGKEQAILRQERQARMNPISNDTRVRDFDQSRVEAMLRDQRLARVRFYLAVRAKMGFPLLPKTVK